MFIFLYCLELSTQFTFYLKTICNLVCFSITIQILSVHLNTVLKCYIILIEMHAVLWFSISHLASYYNDVLVAVENKCHVFLKSIKHPAVRLCCLLKLE